MVITSKRQRRLRDFRPALLLALSAHLIALSLLLNSNFFRPIQIKEVMQQALSLSLAQDQVTPEEEAPQAQSNDSASLDLSAVADHVFRELPFAPRPERDQRHASMVVRSEEKGSTPALEVVRAGMSGKLGTSRTRTGASNHAYRGRDGATRSRALAENGGSERSEEAIQNGLEWLASVQDLNPESMEHYGRWDGDGFMTGYLTKKPDENYFKYRERCKAEGGGSPVRDLGLTALATLAFTGAGHMRSSTEFGRNVSAGLDYILRAQDDQGCFLSRHQASNGDMYDHALSLLATSDYLAMSSDEEVRQAVERGLAFLLARQQPGGGWDYRCYSTSDQTPRSDMSITGFALMAILSARAAGLEIPSQVFEQLHRCIQSNTLADGTGVYADAGIGVRRTSASMTAVNLLSRRLLGQDLSSSVQSQQCDILLHHLPDHTDMASLDSDPYQWYYSSLAFLMEGGDAWQRFNIEMQRSLLASQVNSQGPTEGSWDPDSYYGKSYGRVYSTAISCLCLEVYYRHLPQFMRSSAASLRWLWKEQTQPSR